MNITLRRLRGKSMMPAFRDGDVVLFVTALRIRGGQVVLFRRGEQEYIKRVQKRLSDGSLFVVGDNADDSYDSRQYGPICEEQVMGIARLRLWPLKPKAKAVY